MKIVQYGQVSIGDKLLPWQPRHWTLSP